jgi:hypothetical protein
MFWASHGLLVTGQRIRATRTRPQRRSCDCERALLLRRRSRAFAAELWPVTFSPSASARKTSSDEPSTRLPPITNASTQINGIGTTDSNFIASGLNLRRGTVLTVMEGTAWGVSSRVPISLWVKACSGILIRSVKTTVTCGERYLLLFQTTIFAEESTMAAVILCMPPLFEEQQKLPILRDCRYTADASPAEALAQSRRRRRSFAWRIMSEAPQG